MAATGQRVLQVVAAARLLLAVRQWLVHLLAMAATVAHPHSTQQCTAAVAAAVQLEHPAPRLAAAAPAAVGLVVPVLLLERMAP
jgi:hypothetical protein